MAKQLSLAARPRSLADLIGQEKTVASIKKVYKNSLPKAWLFSGPSGCGKSTISYILALSYQCTHQTVFGEPCEECYANRKGFSIHEIDMAKLAGKEDVKEALSGAAYAPFNGSAYRVYILDECHLASKPAQSLLLRMMEDDTPDTTVFMLCTTAPQGVLETIRTRCKCYQVSELNYDGVGKLVDTLLTRVKSKLPADRLTEALVERGVKYPRLICHAVEKYVGGSTPADAAIVDAIDEIDTKQLTNALVKGDWLGVSKILINAQKADSRSIRLGVIAYLRVILLESPEINSSTKGVAKALNTICSLGNSDDLTLSAGLAAELYTLCEIFSRYPR